MLSPQIRNNLIKEQLYTISKILDYEDSLELISSGIEIRSGFKLPFLHYNFRHASTNEKQKMKIIFDNSDKIIGIKM